MKKVFKYISSIIIIMLIVIFILVQVQSANNKKLVDLVTFEFTPGENYTNVKNDIKFRLPNEKLTLVSKNSEILEINNDYILVNRIEENKVVIINLYKKNTKIGEFKFKILKREENIEKLKNEIEKLKDLLEKETYMSFVINDIKQIIIRSKDVITKELIDEADILLKEIYNLDYIIKGNKDILKDKVRVSIEKIEEQIYTEESINKIRDLIEETNIMLKREELSKSEIQKMLDKFESVELEKIIDSKKEILREELKLLISKTNDDIYTPNTIEEAKLLIKEAELILVKEDLDLTNKMIDKIKNFQLIKKADKEILIEEINKLSNKLDETIYTKESILEANNYIKRAKILLMDENVLQEEVDLFVAELISFELQSIHDLELKHLKETLNNKIEELKKLLLNEDLTEKGIEETKKLIKESVNIVSKEDIDDIKKQIIKIKEFAPERVIEVKKDELRLIVDSLKNKILNNMYTPNSISEAEKIIIKAESVIKDSTNIEIVKDMIKTISNYKLIEKANKEMLKEEIKILNNKLDEKVYTKESIAHARLIIDKAIKTIKDDNSSQLEVDLVIKELREHKLVEIVEAKRIELRKSLDFFIEEFNGKTLTEENKKKAKDLINRSENIIDKSESAIEIQNMLDEIIGFKFIVKLDYYKEELIKEIEYFELIHKNNSLYTDKTKKEITKILLTAYSIYEKSSIVDEHIKKIDKLKVYIPEYNYDLNGLIKLVDEFEKILENNNLDPINRYEGMLLVKKARDIISEEASTVLDYEKIEEEIINFKYVKNIKLIIEDLECKKDIFKNKLDYKIYTNTSVKKGERLIQEIEEYIKSQYIERKVLEMYIEKINLFELVKLGDFDQLLVTINIYKDKIETGIYSESSTLGLTEILLEAEIMYNEKDSDYIMVENMISKIKSYNLITKIDELKNLLKDKVMDLEKNINHKIHTPNSILIANDLIEKSNEIIENEDDISIVKEYINEISNFNFKEIADFSELNMIIKDIEKKINSNKYSNQTISIVSDYYDKAKKISEDLNSSSEEIEKILSEIKEIKWITINYENLEKLIKQYGKDLENNKYIPIDQDKIRLLLKEAKIALEKMDEQKIVEITKVIRETQFNLRPNKEVLSLKIKEILELIDSDIYTEDSIINANKIIKESKEVLNNENSTQKDVQLQINKLSEIKLITKEYAEMQEAIIRLKTEIAKLKKSLTNEDLTEKGLNDTKELILESEIRLESTLAEINEQINKIIDFKPETKLDVAKSDLKNIIEKLVIEIDKNIYTPNSVKKANQLIEKSKELLIVSNDISEIENQKKELNNYNLIRRANKEELNRLIDHYEDEVMEDKYSQASKNLAIKIISNAKLVKEDLNVDQETVVQAVNQLKSIQLEIKELSVKLYVYNQNIEEYKVLYGESLVIDFIPELREEHEFVGWSEVPESIKEDLNINALYEFRKYTVKILGINDKVLDIMTVEHGTILLETELPVEKSANYDFIKWQVDGKDYSFDKEVKSNLVIHSIWRGNVAKSGNEYFGSLKEAFETVIKGDVILLRDYEVKDDLTIPENIILNIPYNSEHNLNIKPNESSPISTMLNQTDEAYINLRVAENVTINILGELIVNANRNSNYNTSMMGFIDGENYSKITLEDGSSINVLNGGSLVSIGFIVGTGRVEGFSGSNIVEALVIWDFKGGKRTLGLNNVNLFPISEYTATNIEVDIKLNKGTNYLLSAVAFMSGRWFDLDIVLIGESDSLLTLIKGYIELSYNTETSIRNVVVYGDISINNVKVQVWIASIDTSKMNINIPANMHFNIKSNSNIELNSNINLLPGSRFILEENSNMIINKGSNLLVYAKEDYTNKWKEIKGVNNINPLRGNKEYRFDYTTDPVFINKGNIDVYGALAGSIDNLGFINFKDGSEELISVKELQYYNQNGRWYIKEKEGFLFYTFDLIEKQYRYTR